MRGIKTKQDRKWKRIIVFYFLLFVLLMLLNSLVNVYKKKKGAEEAMLKMEAETGELISRKEFLEESLNRLSTVDGMKFEIRKKLNVAEVGESVAIIVEEEKIQKEPTENFSSWERFKNFWNGLFD